MLKRMDLRGHGQICHDTLYYAIPIPTPPPSNSPLPSMRSASFEEHALLPESEPEPLDDQGYHRQKLRAPLSGVPVWVIALFAVFIALDIIIYLRISRIFLETKPVPADMPIRNPYIGLDEMYNSGSVKPSKYEPLINVPVLATQVSRAEPDKAFPVDTHQWLSDFGTLSPPDRNLHVSNTIHTIVQFHILDWGMEKCALTVRLPAYNADLPHEYKLKDVRGTIRLDICELEASRPLNALDLTWRKRPKCIKSAGTIDARVGEEVQLQPFACQMGTFRAFEVSCSPDMPSCGVDVWSNHNDTWGLYLTQYQTAL